MEPSQDDLVNEIQSESLDAAMRTIQKFMGNENEEEELENAMANIDNLRNKIKEQENDFVKQVQQESKNVPSVDDIINRYKLMDPNAEVVDDKVENQIEFQKYNEEEIKEQEPIP